jgi:hypothetical protein
MTIADLLPGDIIINTNTNNIERVVAIHNPLSSLGRLHYHGEPAWRIVVRRQVADRLYWPIFRYSVRDYDQFQLVARSQEAAA